MRFKPFHSLMTSQGCLSKKLSILIFNTDPLFHVFDFNMWQNSWEFFANASQFIECTTSYNVNTYICRYGWTVEMVSKIIRKFQANSTQNLKFAFILIDYRWINIIRSFVLRNFILLENFTMSCTNSGLLKWRENSKFIWTGTPG